MLLLPLPSLFGSACLRFFFGGLGFAPKEAKPIAEAMSSSGGEGEREGSGAGAGMLVVVFGAGVIGRGEWWCEIGRRRLGWWVLV